MCVGMVKCELGLYEDLNDWLFCWFSAGSSNFINFLSSESLTEATESTEVKGKASMLK